MREWAARQGIPLLEAARDLPSTEGTAGEPFDYLFSVVNMGLLAPEVLALPRRMAINYHDGPLPRYAGPTPLPGPSSTASAPTASPGTR